MPCWGPGVPGGPGAENNIIHSFIHSFIKRKAPGPLGADHEEETRDTGLGLRSLCFKGETGMKPVPRKLIWRGLSENFLEEVTLGGEFSHMRKEGWGIPVTRDSPSILRWRPEGGLSWEAVCGGGFWRAETGSQEVRLGGESSILSSQLPLATES